MDRIIEAWQREQPGLDVGPVGIVTRLARVRTYLEQTLEPLFAAHGVSRADFEVLVTLRRAGRPFQLPQRALMTQLALTSGTVSVRIDRLFAAGLVERLPDPEDRRGVLVGLTPRGRKLFDAIAPRKLADEDRLLSALSPGERETLAALLRKLLLSFEQGSARATWAATLGLVTAPAHVARELRSAVGLPDRAGLLVQSVAGDSPAARAGLDTGDLLVAAGGRELRSLADLHAVVDAAEPGSRVVLTAVRGVDERTVELPRP